MMIALWVVAITILTLDTAQIEALDASLLRSLVLCSVQTHPVALPHASAMAFMPLARNYAAAYKRECEHRGSGSAKPRA